MWLSEFSLPRSGGRIRIWRAATREELQSTFLRRAHRLHESLVPVQPNKQCCTVELRSPAPSGIVDARIKKGGRKSSPGIQRKLCRLQQRPNARECEATKPAPLNSRIEFRGITLRQPLHIARRCPVVRRAAKFVRVHAVGVTD